MYGRNKICIARVVDKRVSHFVFIIFDVGNKSS